MATFPTDMPKLPGASNSSAVTGTDVGIDDDLAARFEALKRG